MNAVTITTLEQRLDRIYNRTWRYLERIGKAHPLFAGLVRLKNQVRDKLDYEIEQRVTKDMTPHQLHMYYCDTKYCSDCMGSEAEFNLNEARLNAEAHRWEINFPGAPETSDMAVIHQIIAPVGYDAATIMGFQTIMAHLQLKHGFKLKCQPD